MQKLLKGEGGVYWKDKDGWKALSDHKDHPQSFCTQGAAMHYLWIVDQRVGSKLQRGVKEPRNA